MPDFFTEDYPSLIELLERRRGLAQEYLEATRGIKTALDGDDVEAANKGFADRARLITEIDGLHRDLAGPMQSYNDAVTGGVDGDDRLARIRTAIDGAKDALGQARDLDVLLEETVRKLMSDAGAEGRKLKKSRQGISQYYQKDLKLSPTFFDQLN